MENAFPDYSRYMQMWMEFASKMAAAGTTVTPESVPVDVARQLRDSYLRALSEYTEEFMRSPQFTEMMKQATNTAIDMRNQANSMMTQVQHAAGGVARSDLEGLLNSVRRCETRVLERLDEISGRLDQLEAGMVKQQKNGAGAKRPQKTSNGKSRTRRTANG